MTQLTSLTYEDLKNKKFVIAGPNVIESEEHIMNMAKELKKIFEKFDVIFIFKTSFDKANRTSLNSYRGVSLEEGVRILKRVKEELGLHIITDIHESYQAELISSVVDIIQIPAFLCRQTDLLEACAKTNKIIHVKKGQFCSADVMHKCKEKIISFGNHQVILCERGNSFGYQDLVVDPRNLIWLRSDTNLVSMDITHCLQQPAIKHHDGTIKAGGYRDLIPYMGKVAMSLDVNGLFLEVHDNPDKSLCDAPTQWYLDKLEWLLGYIGFNKKNNLVNQLKIYNNTKKIICLVPIKLQSQRLKNKMCLELGDKLLCQHIFDTLIDVKTYFENNHNNIEFKIYCYCSDEAIIKLLPNDIIFMKRDNKLDSDETKGIEIYNSFINKLNETNNENNDDNIILLSHATSPFIKPSSIITGLNNIIDNSHDSAFSVSEIKTFSWFNDKPLNYSFDNIVRTQDIEPIYYETSAFYIFRQDILTKHNRRIGFNPYKVVTDRIESIDIDEQMDYELAVKLC